LSPACYLKDAFPASLFLAWKYADDLESALVANTNLGGDNCHRGIVVGALVGAGGAEVPPRWTERLSGAAMLA
jgi:ADP-ribosylglycohydrolase